MVNLAAPWKDTDPSKYSARESTAAEGQSKPREDQSDVSRSTNRGLAESGVTSSEREVSVNRASGVVASEIYSNGLHHQEVAEKYDVSVRAITWLMKERGIGFAARNQGEPPRHVRVAVERMRVARGGW